MKTIAFCNSTLAWGGGENWHLEAALYMAEQGYSVLMMAHEDGALYAKTRSLGHSKIQLVPLSIGRLSFLNPLLIKRYANILRNYRVDTVIMNLPQDLKCMGLAAKKAQIAKIIYRRGSALPVRNSFLNRYLYGSLLTGLIVNSQATRNEVFRYNKRLISPEKVFVLPNGIDISSFERKLAASDPLPGFEQAENSDLPLGSAGRPIVIGNAGRLNKQKGQQYLLYLAKMLGTMGVSYRLVIAGEGERKEELTQLARALGVEKEVVFTGFLKDTSPFWKSIDLFVLTSLWEGFGYVLLEAMLASRPILAFGVSNIPELVEDGKNGYLFSLPREDDSKSDVEPSLLAMAQAVVRLAQDPQLRVSMGEKGRQFANPDFDQSRVMARLLEYLKR